MHHDAALEHAENAGADECEITSVKKSTTTVRITHSKISEVKRNEYEGCGIRIINNNRIATAQAHIGGMIRGVDRALENSAMVQKVGFWRGLPHGITRGSIPGTHDSRLEEISENGAADIAESMINHSLGSHVRDVSGSLHIVSEAYAVSNSNSMEWEDGATYISGVINAESEYSSGLGHSCGRTLGGFSAEQAGEDAKKMCATGPPARAEPGEYTIILEPYAAGELLALVASPNFGTRLYHEKKSCLSDMMGKKVASEAVSIADEPHMPEGMGSKYADDEGVPTSTRHLVRDGTLCSTISDTLDGYRAGAESTGNASRPGSPLGRGADPVPSSAPHNLCIGQGNMPVEEMVKDTRLGLIIGRLWYTYAVNPVRGDFSCTARSGVRLVQNGQVTDCRQVRIMDNIVRLLGSVSGVGDERRRVVGWDTRPAVTPAIRAKGVHVEPV